MCAIRNKKPKVAEYFIDKGINVNFEVELLVSYYESLAIYLKSINYFIKGI